MSEDSDAFVDRRRWHDGPDWRWKFAMGLVDRPTDWLVAQADAAVLAACAYLRSLNLSPEARAAASAEVAPVAAALLLADDRQASDAAKVLVIGDCPPADIAARLRLEDKVILLWEQLFFDARANRSVSTWLLDKVIRPVQHQDPRLAAKMKFACAGPFAARAALDAERRVTFNAGQRLFDQKLRLALKFEEASEATLGTDRNKLCFMKIHQELDLQRRRLSLAEQRFEARCREILEKQRRAEARRARQQEKRQRQEAARTQEEEVRQERRRAAQERAARSGLAQLRWTYSQETLVPAANAMVCAGSSPGDPFLVDLALCPCPGKDAPAPPEACREEEAGTTWSEELVEALSLG